MKTTLITLLMLTGFAFPNLAQDMMVITIRAKIFISEYEYQPGCPPETEQQRSAYRNHPQYAIKYDASVINPYVEPKTVEQLQTEKEAMVKALFEFRKEQADTNDLPTAQFNLGMMYLNGQGTATNSVLGMTYIKRSATNGNADAVAYLLKNN